MGKYLQGPTKGKADHLVEKYHAQVIEQPKNFADVPEDMALICVVDNMIFDAAAYAYSQGEFDEFSRPCGRPKTWLLMAKALTEKLVAEKTKTP